MTWVDGIIVLFALAFVRLEARREAGQTLLDAVMTLAAVQITGSLDVPVTQMLQWQPMADSDASPLAHGLCFMVCWALGLCIARLLHRQTNWSMDHLDPLIGVGLGLVVAVTVGHQLVDVGARTAIQHYGRLPECLQTS